MELFFFISYDLFFLSLKRTQQFLILFVSKFIWKCWDDPWSSLERWDYIKGHIFKDSQGELEV